MDHHEQHREHHRKEREEKIKEKKEYDQQHEKNRPPIHPAWFWGLGAICVLAAIMIWTFFL